MDGLGYPAQHIDFVLKNGMDAWALTDHGNGSGLAHAQSHAKKMKKAGQKYRQLNGVEFYFVPSLKNWAAQYQDHKDAVAAARSEKKSKEATDIDADDEAGAGHIIENEDETKDASALEIKDDEWKRRYHLVVIAKNRQGLSNLFTLVKRSFKEGYYRFPRIDFDMLKEHGEGLVVSTACIGGIMANRVLRGQAMHKSDAEIQRDLKNLTDRFVDAVGLDNFNLELQFNKLQAQHDVNRHLIDLHKSTGVPLVATCDSHYPTPDKWKTRELYKKLAWMNAKEEPKPLPAFDELKCELYPKNAVQMWEEFNRHTDAYSFYQGNEELVRDAIERTHDITWQQCEDVWVDTGAKLPVFATPEKSEFQQLVDLVKERMGEMGLHENPEYMARVKEELSDIKHLGHASYFLTMYKIFHRAKERTLLGPGRGSAPGSLVNYILGITQIDPLPFGLLWNRFLGRHRVSWPDIDSDAGDRDVLIDAARELFGDDAVIPVSNFNTLKLKSLVKDVAKFFNVPFDEVNAVTGPLQDEVMPHAKDDDQEKSVFVLKHDDCMKYSPAYNAFMTKYPEVEEHVNALFMENRSIGRHAGGVLVAEPKALAEGMPIIGVRGELQTPWTEGMNFRNLEDNGFLKFDFLGLTLLKDVENCIKRILIKQGVKNPTFSQIKDFFDEHLNCRTVKQDDQQVWKHVYHEGRFVGVFQFTADGARKFCLDAKPTNIGELAALTAIYRPGPLKANVHKLYVQAKKDASKIKYDHPVIQDVLGPTFGYVVFQEQFMMLAQKLAGFSPGEADQLRKTLVKKSLDTLGKKSSEKEAARKQFIDGALALHGVPEKVTGPLWDTIEAFSVYGFNKSHSVSYAIDSYYAGWLHTHYEKEWLATILQSETGNPKGLAKAIAEIKAIGYKFSQVDINYSGTEWTYSEEIQAFVPPLTSVKGLGDSAVSEIMENRPYRALDDLLFDAEGEWRHSKLNKSCLESLILTESLGSLQEFKDERLNNHNQLHKMIIENYDTLRKGRTGMTKTATKKWVKAHGKEPVIIDQLIETTADVQDWNRYEKIKNFVEILTTASEELLFPPAVMAKIERSNVPSAMQISPGTKAVVWFCAQDWVKKQTKNGKTFYTAHAVDNNSDTARIRVWGTFKEEPERYTMWLAEVEYDANWGMSSSTMKMRKIEV
jgi:DNA polymerase-3 subunit alpha